MKKSLLFFSILVIAGIAFLFLNGSFNPLKEHKVTGEENPLAREQWEYNRLADPATGKIPSMALWNAYKQLVTEGKMNAQPIYSQADARDVNWQPVNDFFASIAITKITYDPNNTQTFYFCTGEGWYGLGMAIGAGVWKSIDGGTTWNQLSSTANSNFNYCQDIDVNPITSDLYVATLSSGLMRSQDGGQTWHRVLFPSGTLNHSICDVEFTKNGNVFATT
ncbi:MAG: WD40/YVTN/BNR-like repeat-containing protein, partial [Chitinophagales bacterium]